MLIRMKQDSVHNNINFKQIGATIKRCVKRFEAVVTFQVADSTIKTRKEAPP